MPGKIKVKAEGNIRKWLRLRNAAQVAKSRKVNKQLLDVTGEIAHLCVVSTTELQSWRVFGQEKRQQILGFSRHALVGVGSHGSTSGSVAFSLCD